MRWVVALVWLALLAAGLFDVTAKLGGTGQEGAVNLAQPPLSRLDPRVVDVLTAGYRGLYEDFLTIWAVQVLVDENLPKADPAALRDFLLTIGQQGPRLESFYVLGCFVMGLDFHRPHDCEPLTLAGLKALPNSWRIPVTQGFMESYKIQNPERAALYYGLAASKPNAPAFLAPLARHLVENHSLKPEELQETLDHLLDQPAGGRLVEILKGQKP